MSYPDPILERLEKLAEELGVPLSIVQFWEDEFRPGWYFRFHGVLHNTQVLLVEVAGTVSVELTSDHKDEVDLFVFINGDRVGLKAAPFEYLTRRGSVPFRWDDLDEGYEQFDSLDVPPWNIIRKK